MFYLPLGFFSIGLIRFDQPLSPAKTPEIPPMTWCHAAVSEQHLQCYCTYVHQEAGVEQGTAGTLFCSPPLLLNSKRLVSVLTWPVGIGSAHCCSPALPAAVTFKAVTEKGNVLHLFKTEGNLLCTVLLAIVFCSRTTSFTTEHRIRQPGQHTPADEETTRMVLHQSLKPASVLLSCKVSIKGSLRLCLFWH